MSPESNYSAVDVFFHHIEIKHQFRSKFHELFLQNVNVKSEQEKTFIEKSWGNYCKFSVFTVILKHTKKRKGKGSDSQESNTCTALN